MSDLADELTKALAGNADGDQEDEQEQQEQQEQEQEQEEPKDKPVDEKQEEAPAEGDKEETTVEPPPYVKSIPKEEVEAEGKEEASDDDRILLSYLKEQLGEDLTGKYNTDDDMLLGLVNASKMVGKREEDAQKWRALAAAPEETLASWGYTREQAQQQAQQAQQQAQQVQQQTQHQAVQKVEFEDAWMQMVERDEQGQITGTKPGVDPAIAGKLKKAEEYATKQYRDMIFNPEKIISPMLEREREKIREEITSSMQSEMQQQQITNQAWGYLSDEQNKAWLFNNGDMQSGLSQDGIRFKGYVDEAASRGLNPNDINGLIQYATDKMEVDWYRSQQGQQQQKPKRSPGPPAANVSQPDETDIDTERREGETLEESMFRLSGVDPMAGRR